MDELLESAKRRYDFGNWPEMADIPPLARLALGGSDVPGYKLLRKTNPIGLSGAYTSVYEKSDSARVRVEVTVAAFPTAEQSKEFLAKALASETNPEPRPSLAEKGIRIAGSIGFADGGSPNGALYSTLFVRGNVFFQIRNIGRDDVDVTPFVDAVSRRLSIAP